MTEKKIVNKREYLIPLRRKGAKVRSHKKSKRAVDTIKEFIARHMKVADRDTKKVKLDIYLNNEIWFRGRKNPPAKVKVVAKRDGDIVRVELAEMPETVRLEKAKVERRHKAGEKKVIAPATGKKKGLEEKLGGKKEDVAEKDKKESGKVEEGKKKDGKTDEEKKEESGKVKSGEQVRAKAMERAAKAQRHVIQSGKAPHVQRKALKK